MVRQKLAVSGLVSLLFSLGIPGQTPDSSAGNVDRFEKAHEGIYSVPPDKGVAASRLSDAVSQHAPANAPQQKVGRKNFVDEFLFGRMERDNIPHAPLAGDEEFFRRANLDATGSLPTPEAIRAFVADADPAKRDKLIDSLIGSDRFADEWAWFWGDLMRANQDFFHFYNRQWLKADRPYNEVFADLVTAVAKQGHSIPQTGFYHAANYDSSRALSPTDPDNYYLQNRLDFVDEVSIDVSRIFLGINTDCISCHNGAGHLNSINLYLSKRKRAEFQQMAAFFGKMRLVEGWDDRVLNTTDDDTIYDDSAPGYNSKMDAPFHTAAESRFPRDGSTREPAFLLTGEKPRPGENPRQALGRILPTHIQFARAAVNLVWGRLMTVGFVEPYDSFDLDRLDPKNPPPAPWTIQPINPELLEALAQDFRANNFSIQHLIKTIMKSNAYQLSARFDGEWKVSYVPYYARRYARVLSGPEISDAIASATGRPYDFKVRGESQTRILGLATPGDVRGERGGSKNEALMVSALLQAFFQSKRQTPATFGNQATSVQAMLMMVSPVVGERVSAEKGTRLGNLLDSGKNDEAVLEELFLASLGRKPVTAEVTAAKSLIGSDRKTGFENIQWALLNSPEFLVNH
jgi:Protein of unknown function (DUF1549)/Protein of unknown function (DUF1553)